VASLPEIEQFSHDHVFLGASHDANARRTLWVVLLTAVMMVAEIFAGYWTGSMALLADGFHMATHAGALGVAALAYAYARHRGFRRSDDHRDRRAGR
jgi:Co/Zn/Cd efflux system component